MKSDYPGGNPDNIALDPDVEEVAENEEHDRPNENEVAELLANFSFLDDLSMMR